MEIKEAKIEDLAEILKLQKLCYVENAARYNDYTILPLRQTHEELIEEFERGTVLKVMVDSNIVGSIRAYQKAETCYVGKLIVHPEYQNQGIGKTLLLTVEKYFYNVQCFELFIGFKDEKNLYLYKKLGYISYKQERLSPDFSFIHMKKILVD